MSNKYLDMALEKVIKQEVNAALDKIRDEIAKLPDVDKAGVFSSVRMKGMILQIIDKYTAEREVKE